MHVCHPTFGEEVGFDEVLETLIEKVDRCIVSTDAQLLLRDRYETTHGIFNHDTPGIGGGDHPLALVLHHWNEDTITNGVLRERVEQYLDNQIQKHFGLSIDEFLDNPTYVCDLYIKIAGDRARRESDTVDKIKSEFANAGKN